MGKLTMRKIALVGVGFLVSTENMKGASAGAPNEINNLGGAVNEPELMKVEAKLDELAPVTEAEDRTLMPAAHSNNFGLVAYW